MLRHSPTFNSNDIAWAWKTKSTVDGFSLETHCTLDGNNRVQNLVELVILDLPKGTVLPVSHNIFHGTADVTHTHSIVQN